jgi:hypothetical protein
MLSQVLDRRRPTASKEVTSRPSMTSGVWYQPFDHPGITITADWRKVYAGGPPRYAVGEGVPDPRSPFDPKPQSEDQGAGWEDRQTDGALARPLVR